MWDLIVSVPDHYLSFYFPCPFFWNFEFEFYHAGLCIFNKLYMSIV